MNRPSPISRTVSSSSSASSSSSNSSTSLGMSPLQRPSLLRDLRQEQEDDYSIDEPNNNQTPWTVADTQLRPIPPFYPPLNPRCSAFILDSPPSVVASRISDCLKKRSISVQYDDEMVIADCMSSDRVHFCVNLYRGKRTVPPMDIESVDTLPDFSHAVIVEVVRQRGSTLSFHRHCRAVLGAALSHTSGAETRAPVHTSPFEFDRLTTQERPSKRLARMASPSDALVSVERSLALLRKDRIDAQRLGMESLVCLTDRDSSGDDLAVYGSMVVVGAPITGELVQDDSVFEEVHGYLMQLIEKRVLPSEAEEEDPNTSFASSVSTLNCSIATEDGLTRKSKETTAPNPPVDDAHHGGVLRSMALRVLANSLTVLADKQPALLTGILKDSRLVSKPFLKSLAEDIRGGQRLPAVVVGTRLASAHEAALATRCLRLLAQHSTVAQRLLVNPKRTAHPVLAGLRKNRTVGHLVLQRETKDAFAVMSQDVRTC